jgi:hypothetical protein
MDIIVLVLMLRLPFEEAMSKRVEVGTIEECWGIEQIGAACEIHRNVGQEG